MAANPYSTPGPWDLVSSGYAETTMEMLGTFAEEAVRRAGLTPASRVLDVACGPGTVALMVAPHTRHVAALDFAADMLALLRAEINRRNIPNIETHLGDGQALPFADDSFEAAFSMFGLMFFPHRKKGFKELHRTLKKGGRALVSAWAPVSRSPLMQTMFEAIQKINGDVPAPAAPGKAIASLEDPDVFRAEMKGAGFGEVEILPLTKHFAFPSVDRFWADMVKGSAPIVVLRKNLGESVWRDKEKHALQFLKQKLTSPVSLSSEAWLGVGVK